MDKTERSSLPNVFVFVHDWITRLYCVLYVRIHNTLPDIESRSNIWYLELFVTACYMDLNECRWHDVLPWSMLSLCIIVCGVFISVWCVTKDTYGWLWWWRVLVQRHGNFSSLGATTATVSSDQLSHVRTSLSTTGIFYTDWVTICLSVVLGLAMHCLLFDLFVIRLDTWCIIL